jgi:hypothetical protein
LMSCKEDTRAVFWKHMPLWIMQSSKLP